MSTTPQAQPYAATVATSLAASHPLLPVIPLHGTPATTTTLMEGIANLQERRAPHGLNGEMFVKLDPALIDGLIARQDWVETAHVLRGQLPLVALQRDGAGALVVHITGRDKVISEAAPPEPATKPPTNAPNRPTTGTHS